MKGVHQIFGRPPPNGIRRLNEVKIGCKPIAINSIYRVFTLLSRRFQTIASNIYEIKSGEIKNREKYQDLAARLKKLVFISEGEWEDLSETPAFSRQLALPLQC